MLLYTPKSVLFVYYYVYVVWLVLKPVYPISFFFTLARFCSSASLIYLISFRYQLLFSAQLNHQMNFISQ